MSKVHTKKPMTCMQGFQWVFSYVVLLCHACLPADIYIDNKFGELENLEGKFSYPYPCTIHLGKL